MAYTLSGIRNRVLNDKLDDPQFDPDIVDNFINDTQRSIFNQYQLPFTEKVFSGLLPDGGYIFTFPDDHQLTQALKITDPTENVRDITDLYMPYQQFNRAFPVPPNNPVGTPGAWTLHGNKLYLDKPTDQLYTLELYYIKKPTLLADDGDIPELPSEWEELLVLGAYYRVLERNEDFDLATFYKNGDYADELDKLVARMSNRQIGKPKPMAQPLRIGGRRHSGRH